MKSGGSLRVGLGLWATLFLAACAGTIKQPDTDPPVAYDRDTALAYMPAAGTTWWLASSIHSDDEVFLDRFERPDQQPPPELSFVSPDDGALIGVSRPELTLALVDQGGGVDTGSLSFSVDSEPADFNCTFSDLVAACIPVAPLDDGARQIIATIAHPAG